MSPKIHLNFANSLNMHEGVTISLGDIDAPEFTYDVSWTDMNHWFRQYMALEKCKDAFAYRLKENPVIKDGEDPF